MNKDTIQSIRDLAVESEDLQNKANKRLLEITVESSFEDKFDSFFFDKLGELDEESQLEFKRDFSTKLTRWTVVSVTVNNFYSIEQGQKLIKPRKEFIDRVLLRNNFNLPNTGFIPAGKEFSARELLRKIISSAKEEVIFIDCYFHPKILLLIGEILDEGSIIKIKLLTHDPKNTRLSALKNALEEFNKQYPKVIIEAKSGNISLHDRYIVLDSTSLFHFGLSFHALGTSDSSWSEKKDKTEISKTLEAIGKHFSNSKSII